MSKNVSEQLLDILVEAGVERVYGVIGDALNFFVKAIEENKNVEWIACKHEENAAFAAFGESITTGKLAACAGTVGPGALHLINGLYNAKKERTPVIAITGQVPQDENGTDYFQEVDLEKVYADVCDYQAIIKSAEEAPRVIMRAIQIAVSRKTVCRIQLPADIAQIPAKNKKFIHPIFHSDAILIPGESSILAAATALNTSKRICIFAGDGCRNSREEVLMLSEQLKAPIVHTLKSSDIFDHDMKNVVGLTGLIGNPSGYNAVMKCDLLLMLATNFPYKAFLPHDTKTIQVDIREENLGNRTSVDIGVHSDVKPFINALMPQLQSKSDTAFLDRLVSNFQKWRQNMAKDALPKDSSKPLNPQAFAYLINAYASDSAIFTVDTGTSVIWASHHISFYKERRMVGSFNHGSMAVALPAAIGAQMAHPFREVWAICGDGAFNMSMQDLITAVYYKLPIKILVFNNSELSFVKLEMEEAGLAPTLDALHQENMDFAAYAHLCGAGGVTVRQHEDIEDAIIQAKKSTKPFVINAIVNSGAISLPPHIGFKEFFGFGTSKVKETAQAITGDKAQWDNLTKELKSFFR